MLRPPEPLNPGQTAPVRRRASAACPRTCAQGDLHRLGLRGSDRHHDGVPLHPRRPERAGSDGEETRHTPFALTRRQTAAPSIPSHATTWQVWPTCKAPHGRTTADAVANSARYIAVLPGCAAAGWPAQAELRTAGATSSSRSTGTWARLRRGHGLRLPAAARARASSAYFLQPDVAILAGPSSSSGSYRQALCDFANLGECHVCQARRKRRR